MDSHQMYINAVFVSYGECYGIGCHVFVSLLSCSWRLSEVIIVVPVANFTILPISELGEELIQPGSRILYACRIECCDFLPQFDKAYHSVFFWCHYQTKLDRYLKIQL